MSEDIIKDLSNMDVSDDQWVYECAQKAIHEIKRRDAEIARLREALDQIAQIPLGDEFICPSIARAALAEQEKK